MRAYARIRLPDGGSRDLGSGDIIGRMATAALVLDYARVSEAHALITLRAGELRLLPLRGRCAVDGELVTEAVLEPDMVIEPAPGLELLVEDVQLPESVMAIDGDELPLQVLNAVVSLRSHPVPAVLPRYVGDADAHIWAMGSAWRVRVGEGPAEPLLPGRELVINGRRFVVRTTSLERAVQPPTRASGGHSEPLRIIARFDTVHVHRGAELLLVLDGLAARLVSELVIAAVPLDWDTLAGGLWRDSDDRNVLRRRWDVLLARLRRKLRTAGVPADLVRASGNGLVELLLRPGDALVDET
jgi:hypothetical protein